MHVSPAEEGQIHHHHHHRCCLSLTALLVNRHRHRHHHPHQQDNYHNQCIRCQSSVQPSTQTSTHHVASPDSSYIFIEKGNKTTSKFSESFNRIKVELPTFFLLNFCSTKTRLIQLIRYKTLRIFSAKFWSQLHFFSASFLQITCWKVSIRYFSVLILTFAELSRFIHIVYKSWC